MGLKVGAYCTVWEVKPKNDWLTEGKITISHQLGKYINGTFVPDESGQYKTDFSGYITFYGSETARKALSLKPQTKIQITGCDVQNKYDKDKKVMYWNPYITSFELATGGTQKPAQQQNIQQQVDSGEIDESNFPW